ncbi:MAG: sensor histidine kinase [Ferruginibacter sp.]
MKFYKAPDNRINFGIVSNGYKYFVVKLIAGSAIAGQYLSMDNTSIDTVSIFKINNEGTSRLLYQGGSLVAFDTNRNYVWHTLPVSVSNSPSYYLIALKAAQKIINMKYEIISGEQLQKKYQGYGRMVFFYTGAAFIIIMIITLAFFLFRKRVFAAYLGYMVFVSLWITLHYGYFFPYVYPNVPIINEIAKPISTLLASYFLLLVLKLVFIQQFSTPKWLRQIFKGMLYVLPVITMAMLTLVITTPDQIVIRGAVVAAWHAALFTGIAIMVFTPFYFIRTGYTAKLFSFSMGLVCTMLFLQLLANSGYINNFFICEHGVAVGSLMDSFVMAFGLFYNLLQDKKEKERQVLILQKEQTETLKKLITLQDDERKRIAGDLHDNIGPLLAALKINFRRIVNARDADFQNGLVAKTELIIDDSIAEIRNVAHNLMPKGLSANGLINTLNEYLDGIKQVYGKQVVFNHQIQSVLNPDLQINVYRIICELVLNAAKHSNAHSITVTIKADEKSVSFSINDDGKGFQPKAGDITKALGLHNTESRVLYLKGKYALKTEPGKGTAINMEIPLQLHQAKVNGF